MYVEKYHSLFYESNNPSGQNRQLRLCFEFENYSGLSTAVTLNKGGFIIHPSGTDDKAVGVISTRASISIIGNESLGASNFYTTQERSVRVLLKDAQTTDLIWIGFLTPERVQDPWVDGKKYVNLTATDGLSYMADTDFLDENGKYYKVNLSHLTLLRFALNRVGLPLNIVSVGSLRLQGESANGTFEPLAFRDSRPGRLQGLKVLEVLEYLCNQYNARLFQEDGEWWFIRTYDQIGDVHYRRYTPNGTYIDGGLHNTVQLAEYGGLIRPVNNYQVGYDQTLKKINATVKLGSYVNIVSNADFEAFNAGAFSDWNNFFNPTLTRIGSGTASDPYKAKIAGYDTGNIYDGPVITQIKTLANISGGDSYNKTVRFTGKAITNDVQGFGIRCFITIQTAGANYIYALTEQGRWSRGFPANPVYFENIDSNKRSKKSPVEWELESEPINTIKTITVSGQEIPQSSWTGILIEVQLLQGRFLAQTLWAASADPYVAYYDVGINVVDQAINLNTTEVQYELVNDTTGVKNADVELIYANLPDIGQDATIINNNLPAPATFISNQDSTPREMVEHILRERLSQQSLPQQYYDVDLWGRIKTRFPVQFGDSPDLYIATNYRHNISEVQLQSSRFVKLINPTTVSMSLKKNAKLSDGSLQPINGVELPTNMPGNFLERINDLIKDLYVIPNRIKFSDDVVFSKVGDLGALSWENENNVITDIIKPVEDGFYLKAENTFALTLDLSNLSADRVLALPNIQSGDVLATSSTAWMIGGNAFTGNTSAIGSTTDHDWRLIRNNQVMATLKETSIDFASAINTTGKLTIGTIDAENADVDKFLVTNNGEVKFRTGTQLLSDIGAFATPIGLTTNRVTKWSGSALANTQIFDNGTNIGIGTDTPSNRLDISGINARIFGNGNPNYRTQHTTNNVITKLQSLTSTGLVGTESNHDLEIRTNNLIRGVIDTTGRLGLGTTTPQTLLDVRGQISANIGTAAAPTYSFVGDLNTGVFSPSADTIALSTGGTERARINNVGNVGIGTSGLTGYNLRVLKNITGFASAYGISSEGAVQNDVTTQANAFLSNISVAAAPSPQTLSFLLHNRAIQGTIGANVTVTTQIGYWADASLIGATNNYGFRGAIAAGTGRWNNFHDGTAQNHFRGNVGIGAGSTTPTTELDVLGTTRTTNLRVTSGAVVGRYWVCTNADGTGAWTALGNNGYLGMWSPSTNTPTIANGTGSTGQWYWTNAGTWNGITFDAMDQVWYNGSTWERIDIPFTLPTATASVLGGIKVGTGLSIDAGTGILSVNYGTSSTSAAAGNHSHAFGGDLAGSGGTGTIELTLNNVNSNIGEFTKVTVNVKGLVTAAGNLVAADIPNLDAGKITSGSFDTARIPNLDAGKITTGTIPDARIASSGTWNAKQDAISGIGYGKWNGTNITFDNRDFVDLTTAQTIAGLKTFSTGIKSGNTSIYNLTYNSTPSTLIIGGTDLYGAYSPVLFRSNRFIFDRGFVKIGGAVSGLNINVDWATERLDVDGNIKYSGTLKPGNQTPTAGQFLKAPTTDSNQWATLVAADISDLSNILASYASSGHNHSFDSLTDVQVANKATGDLISWNGTKYSNITADSLGFVKLNSASTQEINSVIDFNGQIITRQTLLLGANLRLGSNPLTSVACQPGQVLSSFNTSSVVWRDIISDMITDVNAANKILKLNSSGLIDTQFLPGFVDDVLEYATFSAFPAIGTTGKIFVDLSTNKTYRWSGSTYIELTDDKAVWGAISGTLSAQTDLQAALNAKVSKTGDEDIYGMKSFYGLGRFMGGLSVNVGQNTKLAAQLNIDSVWETNKYIDRITSTFNGGLFGGGIQYRPIRFEASDFEFRRGNVRLGTGVATDRLEVEGNINLSGVIKPDGLAPSAAGKYIRSVDASNMAWSDIVAGDVIDFSSAVNTLINQKLSGTSGQFLVIDNNNEVNAMTLDIKPAALANNKIAIGSNNNLLSWMSNFEFLDGRYLSISRITDNNKKINIGFNKNINDAILQTLGGSMTISASSGVYLGDLAGVGVRNLAVDSQGKIITTALSSGGGSTTTLSSTRIAFGSGINNVTESAQLTWLDDRIIRIGSPSNSSEMRLARQINANDYWVEVNGGKLNLYGESGVVIPQLAVFGADRWVTIDSTGRLKTQAISTGGSGAIPTLSQVAEQTLGDFAGGLTGTSHYFIDNGSQTLAGMTLHEGRLALVGYDHNRLDIQGGTGVLIRTVANSGGGLIEIGLDELVKINDFNFSYRNENIWQSDGTPWTNGTSATPNVGDRYLMVWDGNRWVPNPVRTFVNGGKTYLTLD